MEHMEQWTIDLRNSVTQGAKLEDDFGGNAEEIDAVCKAYPMRIPRYYYNLIQKKGDPIWKQAVASVNELLDDSSPEDPLHEEEDSPVPRLTSLSRSGSPADHGPLPDVLPFLHAQKNGRANQRDQ